jgi:hypothetical protein
VQLNISPDGTVRFVWNDALAPLLQMGTAQVKRASHVEPTADGQWVADLSPVGGPKFGPHTLRADALAAEVRWLDANLHAVA